MAKPFLAPEISIFYADQFKNLCMAMSFIAPEISI
jgi:hypothetical protein